MSDNNAGGAVENPKENGDTSFNREALLEKSPEELAELVMKASAGTIRYKNELEELKKHTPTEQRPNEVKATENNKGDFEAFYAEKKFFEENPEMSEYKDKLTEYTSKGLSWEEARTLVSNQDPSIANRKVASQSNFTAWDTPNFKTSYSQDELKNLPQIEYNRVMELRNQGKVYIT